MIKIINKRIAILKRAIIAAEKDRYLFPEGRLRVNKTSKQLRFYKVTEKGDSTGEYIPKSKIDTIRQLAQKDYNKQFLKTAQAEQKVLENFIEQYQKYQSESLYENLSEERKTFVTPYIPTDDHIAKAWQSKMFKSNPYKPEKKIFDTRKGEKVRSKSEAIIADTLYEFGIPYRYEYPVKMVNGEIKYPDFMLLKVKTKEEIYLEHFGRMGDEEYRKDAMDKMDLYRASGIYPGKNLIFTYETDKKPLDIKGMRKMLFELFCHD